MENFTKKMREIVIINIIELRFFFSRAEWGPTVKVSVISSPISLPPPTDRPRENLLHNVASLWQ